MYGLSESPSQYQFLMPRKKGKSEKLPHVLPDESKEQAVNIKKIMKLAGFGARAQEEIFKLLGSIILLGNI